MNLAEPTYNMTPLHTSCRSGSYECVVLLLENNADFNARDAGGFTVLHICAQKGFIEFIQLFLDRGISVNSISNNCFTPLMLASGMGHVNVCEFLLARGANLNMKDDQGYQALHAACIFGHQKIALLLIMNGSDLSATNTHGYTPIEVYGKSRKAQQLFSRSLRPKLCKQLVTVYARESRWRRRKNFVIFMQGYQNAFKNKNSNESTEKTLTCVVRVLNDFHLSCIIAKYL